MSLTIKENDLYTVTTVSIIFFPENGNIYYGLEDGYL